MVIAKNATIIGISIAVIYVHKHVRLVHMVMILCGNVLVVWIIV